MKKENLERHQKALEQILSPIIGQRIGNVWDYLDALVKDYHNETEAFIKLLHSLTRDQDRIKALQEHIMFRKRLIIILSTWADKKKQDKADSFVTLFEQKLAAYLGQIEEFEVVDQSDERFVPTSEDSLKVRVFKLLKRRGYALGDSPRRIGNLFRRLFRKPILPAKPWKQKVPVVKLSNWYYHNVLLGNGGGLLDQNQQKAAMVAYDLWKWDDRIYDTLRECLLEGKDLATLFSLWDKEFSPAIGLLRDEMALLRKKASENILALLQNSAQQFAAQAQVAGTLEFKTFKHLETRRISKLKKTKKNLLLRFTQRNNTFLALADDWIFNQEIYFLSNHVFKTGLQFRSRILSRAEPVLSKLKQIKPVLSSVKEDISLQDHDAFRQLLLQLKHNAGKNLQGIMLPDLINLILEQNFPLMIDEAEQAFQQELQNLAAQRIIIPDFDPAKPYPDKMLQPISPSEIIEFEMTGLFRKTFLKAKTQTIERLEAFRQEFEDLGRMVVYNLDSCIAMLDQQGEEALSDCLLDAREGMDRAMENTSLLVQKFEAFNEELIQEVREAGNTFIKDIKSLTDNRNVEQIRYRITRARALRKGSEMLERGSIMLVTGYNRSRAFYRLIHTKVNSGINIIKGQLGIQGLAADITEEISDFLVAAQAPLPFVYKRLFQIEPLREPTFYLELTAERIKLLKAYEKWQKGAFSPVLIYGERGSGISTFSHMFVRENMLRSPVVFSILPSKRINSEEDLLAILGQGIRGQAFNKAGDFYEFIEKQEPFVVFVDKLHLMFLRQPGGFNTLKRFFELISSTNKKIFWICTCGLYASAYLDKVIGLYSYFPVSISMRNLGIEEVKKVIMLRHKTSGYTLHFNPSPYDLQDKSFQKKDSIQKQQYLMEKFFASLNRLTQSNIAFALQLWLRSAEKLEDNKIFLHSLEGIDFGFMHNMSSEVIFALHALLMHENLDVFQLSQVLNTSRRQAYLMLMRLADRGVIVEERGFYAIHPLLYRQTILLLKDKSFIH